MRRVSAGLLLLALGLFTFVSAETAGDMPAVFIGDPALSPDGTVLAFEYEGDIWTVPARGGEARRLTLSVAVEKRPLFSPDGRWIVFSGALHGNLDLYVMPADGGEMRRLTFSPASELPCSFSPDGRYVYFYSWSDYRNISFDLFKVPFEGGTPMRLAWAFRTNCYSAAVSPDGSRVCFVSRSGNYAWRRRGFRGPSTAELYLARNTVPFSELERFTKNRCQDFLPPWTPDGKGIWFVSDRDGEYNLYLASPDEEGEPRRVTSFRSDGIRWYTVAAETGKIVLLRRYRLYSLDPDTGATELIPVRIYSPPKYALPERREAGDITEYALSPDGAKVVFARGHDLFVAPAGGGHAKRLTATPSREYNVEWTPDSKRIVFNRLVGGAMAVVLLDLADGTERVLTRGRPNRFTPLPDPAGEYFYCQHDYKRIARVSFETGKEEPVVNGVFARRLFSGTRWFDLTPGGKALLYFEYDEAMEDALYYLPLDGKGDPVPVSRLGGSSVWGGFTPDYGVLWFYNNSSGEWKLYCIRFDGRPRLRPSPRERLESLLGGGDEGEKATAGGEKELHPPSRDDVRRLADRAELLFPSVKGAQHWSALLKNGRRMLFTADTPEGRDIFIADIHDPRSLPRRLTKTPAKERELSVHPSGKFCYFLADGALWRLEPANGKTEKLAFSGCDYISDLLRDAAAAVLDEMLWLLDYGFYDPAHHGADIELLRAKYRPLVHLCRTQDPLEEVLRDLLAEFNASHMGITLKRRPTPAPQSENVPLGGFTLEPESLVEGRFVVRHVVEGSPGDGLLRPGDRLLSVGGVKPAANVNLFDLLRRFRLAVPLEVAGKDGATRTVFLPLVSPSTMRKLVIDEWVASNRKYVEEKSGGKVGYVWVSRMYQGEFEKFKREISAYMSGFRGVIVDFRFNSGGRTAHDLLEVMDDTPWLFTRMRGGRTVPIDADKGDSFQMPVVGLFNHSSMSNAEMMCCGFRLRSIGPTVGEPTGGGVIGTWSKILVDGSKMRLPRFAVFERSGRNLEGSPTEPDFIVEKTVIEEMNGLRPQLDRANELILSGKADRKGNKGR